jgi:hypothetical protein
MPSSNVWPESDCSCRLSTAGNPDYSFWSRLKFPLLMMDLPAMDMRSSRRGRAAQLIAVRLRTACSPDARVTDMRMQRLRETLACG